MDRAQITLRAMIKLCQLSHAKKSDPLGAGWCQKKFIGRIRREIEERHARDVLSFGAPQAPPLAAEMHETLKEECLSCGECSYGRE